MWNKERIGDLIQTVDFRYKIVPYATQSMNETSGFQLTHTNDKEPSHEASADIEAIKQVLTYEEELEEQLENTVRTIYFYEQSYLVDWVRAGVI